MPTLLVTYGIDARGLAARVDGQTSFEFTHSVPWRLEMFEARAYLEDVTDECLIFDEELPYRQCQEIVASLRRGEPYGVVVKLDSSYTSFINTSQTYIDERSRVGLAIKTCDESVMPAFAEFSEVVEQCMVRPLRHKQMLDAFFMATMRWSANFSVPGSGKTASVLGAYCYLRDTGLVDRIVVVCPKSAFESWIGEWDACLGDMLPLSCFSLGDPAVMRLSKIQRKKTIQLDADSYNLMLFNYEALGSYVEELRPIVADRTLLVFDEVHRVKAVEGQRARWALDVSERAAYVTVLTGTPIPNTYVDIYNFLHIMYPRDYDTFFGYEKGFLKDPDMFEIQDINDSLQPFYCRTNKDELGVPRPEPNAIITVEATYEENRLMHILRAAYQKNHLVLMIRALQLASDASMLAYALDPEDFEYVLDQVGEDIDDIDFVDYSEEVPQLIEACRMSPKMEACKRLVSRLVSQGKPVIVWCIFVRSITRIAQELNGMGISTRMIVGATSLEERERILNDYRMGLFSVLVTNPHTLAESVSLHQVCHDGVYFEYSYNLVHLLQSKDRIHRLGLPPHQYTQYHFLQTRFALERGPWSLDEKIYQRLLEKEQTMLDAIDGGYLECGYVDDRDLEIVLGGLFDGVWE